MGAHETDPRSEEIARIRFHAIQDEPSIRGVAIGSGRRVGISPAVRSALVILVPALALIVLLAWPLVLTRSYFNPDWSAQAWFLSQQALAIRANHVPSLFLNYQYGAFYPHYAFYGGTLYAIGGTLSLLLGSAPIDAYVLTYLLGFVAAYGGWYWMARMAGLSRLWSHVPGLVFITSAYYLTLIYARGDWPEFIAVSMIPLVAASGLNVLRAERLRIWPAVVFTLSSIVFFGSHSLTLVWGSTMMIVIGLAILLCIPRARREVTRAGAIRVASLVVPALLVNAWFLLPAVAYQSSTEIASQYVGWEGLLRNTMSLVSVQHLFTFSRASASTPGAAFALSLPILVMGWGLLSVGVFAVGGLRGAWSRMLLICAVLTVAFTVLMTHAGLILALPKAYGTLQFSYRLESYVLLALSGTVLAALVLGRRGSRLQRIWSWTLPPLLIVSLVGAVQQSGAYPHSEGTRARTLAEAYTQPNTGERLLDYLDVHLPGIAEAENLEKARFPPAAVRHNHISIAVHAVPNQLLDTNLQGPPSLIDVAGARIVGIDHAGYDVLEVDPGRSVPRKARSGGGEPPAVRISVSPSASLPVVLGRVLSACALAFLVLGFLVLLFRRWVSAGGRA